MAKRKKRTTLLGEVEEAFSDVADAVSVAATGSQIGVLELAAEEEFEPASKRRRKTAGKVKVKVPARKRKKAKAARVAPVRKKTSRKKKSKSRKTPTRRR
jgi:hypothetical protein